MNTILTPTHPHQPPPAAGRGHGPMHAAIATCLTQTYERARAAPAEGRPCAGYRTWATKLTPTTAMWTFMLLLTAAQVHPTPASAQTSTCAIPPGTSEANAYCTAGPTPPTTQLKVTAFGPGARHTIPIKVFTSAGNALVLTREITIPGYSEIDTRASDSYRVGFYPKVQVNSVGYRFEVGPLSPFSPYCWSQEDGWHRIC